jgi:hypothetical protein
MLNRRLIGGAIMALVIVTVAAPQRANAGIWAWGCASAFQRGEQIIFNREVLLMLDEPSTLSLKAIIVNSDGLEKHPRRSRFNSLDLNSGFEPKLKFGPDKTEAPLVLIQRSTKRISHRTGRAGPRDEITTRWRKVYRLEGHGEKPRDVAMDCLEYILTSKGGRGE